MRAQLSFIQIAGVALMLFSSILLGVGIHHLVATGTCSSTGYSANYGPVPYCPSGTGWWFGFVFGGIIGGLAGSMMAARMSLVFASIFSAIGFGSLSLLLDSGSTSEKVFAGIFGGCFAIVGVGAAVATIASVIGSLRGPKTRSPSPRAAPVATTSAFGTTSDGSRSAFGGRSAFGDAPDSKDPILGAYNAARQAQPTVPAPSVHPSAPGSAPGGHASPAAGGLTPFNLLPGLQALKKTETSDPVDELAKLADLHQRGALSDAEFASAKAKLLGQV